jgi:hypothetical protein
MKKDFTVENLRLEEGGGGAVRIVQSKAVRERLQRRRKHFVRVPMAWVERLARARRVTTVTLAHYILYEHWKAGARPFRLANATLVHNGISRKRKYTGLRELERLGLVTVARRPRKSPVVTVMTEPAAPSVPPAGHVD